MAKLTYADLKKQGVVLTKEEAQSLHSRINHIAQRGADGENELFPGNKEAEENPKRGGISSLKDSTGFDPNPPKETAKEKVAREKLEKKAEEAEEKRLKALSDAGLEEREVTQEDLDADPALVEANVQVGDVHQFPIVQA